MQLGVEIEETTPTTDHTMRRPEVQQVTVKAAPNTDVYEFRLPWPAPHNSDSTFKVTIKYQD